MNGLRVSEACSPDVDDLGGVRYQPTLRIIGKGDKPAEVPLNPRTHEAIAQVLNGRTGGPLLLNRWGNRMNATTPLPSSADSPARSESSAA